MSDEFGVVRGTTYRYPPAYRVMALLGTLLFGLILLGSVIAEVEAIKNSRADAVLHVIGFVVGLAMVLVGLDFAMCAIKPTSEGLHVRGLRKLFVPWTNVAGWRYLPLSLIHIRLRRGPGLFVWPLLEHYTDLLNEIDARRPDKVTR